MEYSIWQWFSMSVVCGAACIAALYWYKGLARSSANQRIPIAVEEQCVFLFDGCHIESCTPHADAMLTSETGGTDWERLHYALIDRFPTFPSDPGMLVASGTTLIRAIDQNDDMSIRIEPLGAITRVELVSNGQDNHIDFMHARSDWEAELSTLWHTTNNAPYPIWRVNQKNAVVWHNPAYDDLYLRTIGRAPRANSPLFADLDFDKGSQQRGTLTIQGTGELEWHDVKRLPHDDGFVLFANDVTPVVHAETAQRNFVQTLAKTFAQLSIGLAIFDRNMQLVLFNPALTDLTALAPEFLSARPNLLSFFDRLRDARVMPEPKDYSSWRDQMAAMVAQANDGRYSETWALPSGSTYRVTGRPHPDGAVAFLFEDISAEISLTRRFRTDLEVSQNILDELDDAIAVFSSNGTLTVTNTSYCALWEIEPDKSFAEFGIIDAMRDWQRLGGSHRLWGDIRDFVLSQDNRTTWSSAVSLRDGREFDCIMNPLQHGASLVRFVAMQPVDRPMSQSALDVTS